MGNAYPTPGLTGKFYDADMVALVEVVRDTVGRHDTFALACNAKYYEDLGYPGHVNCSDNFNVQVEPYAIAARKGWPALNFFFNTAFNATTSWSDEPSRPGDYVLLRAMTDLVCASSACPDDVDAANACDPTDIHVRVYGADHRFSKAIAHRVTADAEAVLTKKTTFHPRIEPLTRNLVEYAGYWLPTRFNDDGAIAEYWACRNDAVVMDLSPLRKFEILGPDAETLMQATITRDARKLSVGQVVYTALCNETGGMIDDATVFRLGQDNFRFVGGDDYDGVWLKEQAERAGLRVWVKPSTDQLHNLRSGTAEPRDPRALRLDPDAQPSLDELTWFRFCVGRIGTSDGVPIIVSRTGYTGELGYEVWCHPDDGPAVWDAVWEAGGSEPPTPFGLDALDMVRIEAGLIVSGNEFDDQIDPFEAGIGFTVDLRNDEDFVGRAALLERSAHPSGCSWACGSKGTRWAHGDPSTWAPTGRSSRAAPDPRCSRRTSRSAGWRWVTGTGLGGRGGQAGRAQKRIPATVVPFPFYDPEQARPSIGSVGI
jgi:aminomethyltransferase